MEVFLVSTTASLRTDRGDVLGVNVSTFCPPFRELTPAADRAVVDMINAARPHIVWVGLSTSKQERWMAAHLGRFDVPVLIGVGAAFDFLGGRNVRHRSGYTVMRSSGCFGCARSHGACGDATPTSCPDLGFSRLLKCCAAQCVARAPPARALSREYQ
jgi:hypothetical protein